LAELFEPWHSREDLENITLNNTKLSKWYNRLIDTTQKLCILQELLNCNTQNIAFTMNWHHTFMWLRYANMEDIHSRMLLFYLDEEGFEKEVMSWPRVKHNLWKLGMHSVFHIELLKKKGQEVGVGPSLGPKV
jgi:hypothetical protein